MGLLKVRLLVAGCRGGSTCAHGALLPALAIRGELWAGERMARGSVVGCYLFVVELSFLKNNYC